METIRKKKHFNQHCNANFQKNFAKYTDIKFAREYSLKNVKKDDLVGFDLCVLASSDHTLITYGSFGLWGAILSGGDVIAAKGTNKKLYSVVTTYVHMLCYDANIIKCLFLEPPP